MNWRDGAACLRQEPELFFPTGLTVTAMAQLEAAKNVCSGCIVRQRCLEWAIETGTDHGVWGGLSEDERRSLRRRTARIKAAEIQLRR